MKKLGIIIAACALLLMFAACGGNGDGVVVAPTITTEVLPGGFVTIPYNQTLQAAGTTPIAWSIVPGSGSLPAGLQMNMIGQITGTPTAEGSSTFTVRAENREGHDTQVLTIVIAPTPFEPTIITEALPGGIVGELYNETLVATGTEPITWSVTAGSLEPLSLNAETGAITGTPTAPATLTFTVTATNVAGSVNRQLTINITAYAVAPNITTTTLPAGNLEQSFTATLAATGTSPFTWSAVYVDCGDCDDCEADDPCEEQVSSLPAGLTISEAGVVSGTPTVSGTFTFYVSVQGPGGSDEGEVSVTIAPITMFNWNHTTANFPTAAHVMIRYPWQFGADLDPPMGGAYQPNSIFGAAGWPGIMGLAALALNPDERWGVIGDWLDPDDFTYRRRIWAMGPQPNSYAHLVAGSPYFMRPRHALLLDHDDAIILRKDGNLATPWSPGANLVLGSGNAEDAPHPGLTCASGEGVGLHPAGQFDFTGNASYRLTIYHRDAFSNDPANTNPNAPTEIDLRIRLNNNEMFGSAGTGFLTGSVLVRTFVQDQTLSSDPPEYGHGIPTGFFTGANIHSSDGVNTEGTAPGVFVVNFTPAARFENPNMIANLGTAFLNIYLTPGPAAQRLTITGIRLERLSSR